MPEYEELHLPSQRRAVPVMILSVHPEGGSLAVCAVYIEISGGRVKKPVILAAGEKFRIIDDTGRCRIPPTQPDSS
jgi:hypothetical protein